MINTDCTAVQTDVVVLRHTPCSTGIVLVVYAAALVFLLQTRSGTLFGVTVKPDDSLGTEVHIRMDGSMSLKDAHDITKNLEASLKKEFGQETHIGIHMEPMKQAF